MMKKEYLTPEMIVRKVFVENIMQVISIVGEEGSFEGANARGNDDWDDDDDYDNVWSD